MFVLSIYVITILTIIKIKLLTFRDNHTAHMTVMNENNIIL